MRQSRPVDDEKFWQLTDRLDWSRTGDDRAWSHPSSAVMTLGDIESFDRILTDKL